MTAAALSQIAPSLVAQCDYRVHARGAAGGEIVREERHRGEQDGGGSSGDCSGTSDLLRTSMCEKPREVLTRVGQGRVIGEREIDVTKMRTTS